MAPRARSKASAGRSQSPSVTVGKGWFAIHDPEQEFFRPVPPVTAVWANEDHLDLVAVDQRGAVQSIWWDRREPAGYRRQGWFVIHPETKFPPEAAITALWANKDHLDLFASDTSGVVQSIWWDRNVPSGYRAEGWFGIHPETRTAPGGASDSQLLTSTIWICSSRASTAPGPSSIWYERNEPSGYRAEGWFAIGPERRFQPGAGVVRFVARENRAGACYPGIHS